MAANSRNIPWEKLFRLAETCNKASNPRSFVIDLSKALSSIASFDNLVAYFFDANGKVNSHYEKNVDEDWVLAVLAYGEMINGKNYPFTFNPESTISEMVFRTDWSRVTNVKGIDSGFMEKIIKPRKLTYSVNMPFFDMNGMVRVIVALNRTRNVDFSDDELTNLRTVVPMLIDIYRKFYYRGDSLGNVPHGDWVKWHLTAREIEIVDLLTQGLTYQQISNALFISPGTTYKHVQHIYEKMNVNSQQELLVKVLSHSEE